MKSQSVSIRPGCDPQWSECCCIRFLGGLKYCFVCLWIQTRYYISLSYMTVHSTVLYLFLCQYGKLNTGISVNNVLQFQTTLMSEVRAWSLPNPEPFSLRNTHADTKHDGFRLKMSPTLGRNRKVTLQRWYIHLQGSYSNTSPTQPSVLTACYHRWDFFTPPLWAT